MCYGTKSRKWSNRNTHLALSLAISDALFITGIGIPVRWEWGLEVIVEGEREETGAMVCVSEGEGIYGVDDMINGAG